MSQELHDHDRGLSHDLPMLARRRMIRLLAGASLVPVVGCAGDDSVASSSPAAGSSAAASDASCETIPGETAGPYPGDGSNGVNVLKESGVVRSDITSSFGSADGKAEGVPLTITLTVVDAASGCGTPMAGAAVYLWHCDRDGNYSLYSEGVTEENYLRGVQVADAKGQVTFTSIFPACYIGPLAAHPLRGLRKPGRRHRRRVHHRHLAARSAEGGLRRRVRLRRLQPQRAEHE